MKKILLTTTFTSLLALGAEGAVADSKGKGFEGFSATLGGGYSIGRMTQDTTLRQSPNTTTTIDGSVEGALGSLGFGWGTVIGKSYYLGLEAFGDISNVKGSINDHNDGFEMELKKRHAYGGALKVGKVFDKNNLVYLKAGAVSGKWKMRVVTVYQGYGLNEKDENLIGFTGGLGFEHMLCDNLAVGGEVMYSRYKMFDYKVGPVGNPHVTYSVRPTTTDVKLFVSWKINP